ncbi:NifB/NifX family molybdenum-iron cluster-binding protein [candidate division WOR-3 bacterium]|nr:NifB/NifX family molybdenum-iron cluster-binding protein [candidate division WOR-3 bacterium]
MKVAVTSTGATPDSAVDERFGRCRYFVIVNTDDDSFEAVENDASVASGAGVNAAQLLAGRSVEAVVTGNCGPKAFSVLNAAGMPVHTGASGTVAEAVAAFRRGELAATSGPTGPAHAGQGGW